MQAQLAAGLRPGVTELAEAVERIGCDLADTGRASQIFRQAGHNRHARIVERSSVRRGPVWQVEQFALPMKSFQPGDLFARESRVAFGLLAGGQRPGKTVEARLLGSNRALEGGERLAEIGKDAVHALLLVRAHRRPGGLLRIRSERPGLFRHRRQVGQRPKNALVALVEILGDEMRIEGARAAMLPPVLQRRQRLRPQAVAAPVPEEPRPQATPASGMVRRSVVPMPLPRGRSSWNCRSMRWQVPQETTPSLLMR